MWWVVETTIGSLELRPAHFLRVCGVWILRPLWGAGEYAADIVSAILRSSSRRQPFLTTLHVWWWLQAAGKGFFWSSILFKKTFLQTFPYGILGSTEKRRERNVVFKSTRNWREKWGETNETYEIWQGNCHFKILIFQIQNGNFKI